MGTEPSVREAFEALAEAMARAERAQPDYSAEIVMKTVKPVLELAYKSFPRADDRRKAKAAYRMVCAELGEEE